MRVMNDREEETQKAPPETVFDVVALSLLCGLGLASGILGPLPMILSEIRLVKPWGKVAPLVGAVFSVVLLGIPPQVAVIGFVTGIYVADSIGRRVPLWRMLIEVVYVGVGIAGVLLFAYAYVKGWSVVYAWGQVVDALMLQLREGLPGASAELFSNLREVFYFEGPFLFVSALILTAWLSVGFASHLRWLANNPSYCGEAIREQTLPRWFSGVCIAVLAGLLVLKLGTTAERIVWGIFRPLSMLLLIQGTIALSRVLARRILSPWIRSWIYVLALTFGFYALIGAGAIAPWLTSRKPSGSRKVTGEVT